jgi:hypothetical protein
VKTDIKASTNLMHKVADVVANHDPSQVFDVCMTLLAMNDVLCGCPDQTLSKGRDKLMAEVYHLSLIVQTFIHNHSRMPTMTEVIEARHQDLQRECNEHHRQLH